MTGVTASDFRHPPPCPSDTILRLRWLAALGQLAAIFIVSHGLNSGRHSCVATVGPSALVNLACKSRSTRRLNRSNGALLLVIELYLPGGLKPFSFLFLARS
jgi:two-component system sensor histidine kinase RegB